MGLDAMILVFRMLSFQPAFTLSSFTLIKRLFSSSSLYAIRVVIICISEVVDISPDNLESGFWFGGETFWKDLVFEIGFGKWKLGEVKDNTLQYSCLENPRDGRAWWAAIYGVTQSRTRLKRLSSSILSDQSEKSEKSGIYERSCCCCCEVSSVVSDSVQPHRQQPTRLFHPWDSPGKNTGVGCHFLLQCMKVKSESEVTQSCPTLHDLMDCSLPGSPVHEIFQARVLEWVAISCFNERRYSSKKCMQSIPNQQ